MREDEWGSNRIGGDPLSSPINLPIIDVIDGRIRLVATCLENEMGHAYQLVGTAQALVATANG